MYYEQKRWTRNLIHVELSNPAITELRKIKGIYLYNILVFSVFKSNERMLIYNIIGWLIPSIISWLGLKNFFVRFNKFGLSFWSD